MVELSVLNFGISYLAGLITFFAGCIAPVAPVYVSFLASTVNGGKKSRLKFSRNAIGFTFGFLLVFLFLGIFVNTFARRVLVYRLLIERLGGVVLILMGLMLGNFVEFKILLKTYKFRFDERAGTMLGAVLLGATFGFAWTPCIGPVLSAILVWISLESSLNAIFLLILFALGLGTPFLLLGIFFDGLWPYFKSINKHSALLTRVSGFLLIVFGVLLLTGYFGVVSNIFLRQLGSSAFFLEFR